MNAANGNNWGQPHVPPRPSNTGTWKQLHASIQQLWNCAGKENCPEIRNVLVAVLNEFEHRPMQKITPCLWFEDNAEEAVKFYTSLFRNSKILQISHYGEAGSSAAGRPKGSTMTITFQLDWHDFMALTAVRILNSHGRF